LRLTIGRWTTGDDSEQAAREIAAGALAAPPNRDAVTVTLTGRNLPFYPRRIQLTGIDFSPAMLEIARDRAAELGVNVALIEGDAQDLPFADRRFDTLVCTLALRAAEPQYFPPHSTTTTTNASSPWHPPPRHAQDR